MSSFSLLCYTEEQKIEILRLLNTNVDEVSKKVKYLREWMEAQPYFSEVVGDEVIERFFLTQLSDLEKTKNKITGYYMVRTILPDFFHKNPNSPELRQVKKSFVYAVLPNLTQDDFGRVVVNSFKENCEHYFDPVSYFAYIISILEVRVRTDFCYMEKHIYDLKNVKLGHLVKFTPSVFKQLNFLKKKLSDRSIVAINFVNVPSYVEPFLNTMKGFLKPKLQDRMKVHKDLESLYKIIPQESCPKEYGGSAESILELEEKWEKKLSEYDLFYENLKNLYIKMDLLPDKLKPDDDFGVHGNFRKLEID